MQTTRCFWCGKPVEKTEEFCSVECLKAYNGVTIEQTAEKAYEAGIGLS